MQPNNKSSKRIFGICYYSICTHYVLHVACFLYYFLAKQDEVGCANPEKVDESSRAPIKEANKADLEKVNPVATIKKEEKTTPLIPPASTQIAQHLLKDQRWKREGQRSKEAEEQKRHPRQQFQSVNENPWRPA